MAQWRGLSPLRVGERLRSQGQSGLEKARHRKGAYKCKDCRKQFTVTVGTIFEGSHIPLHKWLMAIHLLCASKKGMSAHQLHRLLGITYKSAWFMAHRIREAIRQEPLASKLKGTVEVDETYVGGKARMDQKYDNKTPVIALVERSGHVRDGKVIAYPVQRVTAEQLKGAIRAHVDQDSLIMTDEHPGYKGIGKEFKWGHETVCHSAGEYVRGGGVNKYRRRVLLPAQAGDQRHVSPRQQEAFTPLL